MFFLQKNLDVIIHLIEVSRPTQEFFTYDDS